MLILLLERLVMYINLQFSDDQCDKLIYKLGYKVETITLYYYSDIDPYGKYQELNSTDFKVVYKGEKPKELCVERPLFSECSKYLYSNVIEKIVNECIFNAIL